MSKLSVFGKAHEAAAAAGPFHWFIYGSSLDRAAFATWAQSHGYAPPDLAAAVPVRLPGYRLAFDVVSRYWGGATASLAEAPGEEVEGVILRLPPDAKGLVDHKEGAISGLYEPFEVTVIPLAGGEPVPAVAYRTTPGRRQEEQPPAPRFLETIIAGGRAAGLSAGWLSRLEALRP